MSTIEDDAFDIEKEFKKESPPDGLNEELVAKFQNNTGEEAQNALQQLILWNGNMVTKIISEKYPATNTNPSQREDAMMVGLQAIMEAAKDFDLSRGTKFSTYAWKCIWSEIAKEHVESSRTIKLPSDKFYEMVRIKRAIARLQEGGSESPTKEDIAKAAGIKEDTVELLLPYTNDSISLDSRINVDDGDEPMTILETLSDDTLEANIETLTLKRELADEVTEAVNKLKSERKREIIKRHFGIAEYAGKPQTFADIAKEFGVSQQRIRDECIKAMRQLKHPSFGLEKLIDKRKNEEERGLE